MIDQLLNSFSGLGQWFTGGTIYMQYTMYMIIIFLIMINIKYMRAGTEAFIYGRLFGYNKMVILGNDGKERVMWVDFKSDYTISCDRAYVHDPKEIINDEFGNKKLVYTQDFTEPVHHVPFKKYVYVDKATKEPIKDAKGFYATAKNILMIATKQYDKRVTEEFKKMGDFIQPKNLENVIPQEYEISSVMYPTKVKDSKRGIDSAITADIIVRRMKIEFLTFIEKNWRPITIFGAVVVFGTLGVLAMVYGQSKVLDDILLKLADISTNVKAVVLQ